MRQIEKQMINAVLSGNEFYKDNTRVHRIVGGMEVQLFGNVIGVYQDQGGGNYGFNVNIETLKNYPSHTTRSRLRALGVDVYQKDHKIYIGDQLICDLT